MQGKLLCYADIFRGYFHARFPRKPARALHIIRGHARRFRCRVTEPAAFHLSWPRGTLVARGGGACLLSRRGPCGRLRIMLRRDLDFLAESSVNTGRPVADRYIITRAA
jgi:hypothetical protein